MRRIIVLLAATCSLAVFASPASAQVANHTKGWGKAFGDSPTNLNNPNGAAPAEVADMVTTNSNTYVLDGNGNIWAAGSNSVGELGQGSSSGLTSSVDLLKIKTCFVPNVATAGTLESGRCPQFQSLALVGPNGTIMAIAAGVDGQPGDVYGWGWNSFDQLCASDQTIQANAPAAAPKGTSVISPVDLTAAGYVPPGVTMVAGAGDHATYYVGGQNANSSYPTNTLWSCGQNNAGELGDGTTDSEPSPTPVPVTGIPLSMSPVESLTAAWRDEGVLLQDGTYWTWGDNNFGQLGYSTTNECVVLQSQTNACGLSPEQVIFPNSLTVMVPANPLNTTVSMGGGGPTDGQTIAILSNGDYYGWGDDTDGQLCNGSTTMSNNGDNGGIPLTGAAANDFTSYLAGEGVPAPSEVASGGTTGYLLNSTSGDVWSCGNNSRGQLGNGGTPTDSPTPVETIGNGNATSVSSTNFNTSAVVAPGG